MVNGKSERRYGRFDFDPTELKTARQRLAAANAAAVEFEREQQAQIDKEMAWRRQNVRAGGKRVH